MNNKCKECKHIVSCVEWFSKEFHPISKNDFCDFVLVKSLQNYGKGRLSRCFSEITGQITK